MNPEKATDYLARVNWKSFVEWLTAETILNRPLDPIQFSRDIIGEKLANQVGTNFRPDLVTDWLRNCYTEATALVDENGVIHGKKVDAAQRSLPEQITELRRKIDGMQKLLDAAGTIAVMDPIKSMDNIITECCRILSCDRTTIYSVDNVTDELVLTVSEGAKQVRVPLGQGVAGTVATTGEIINIQDAYSDSRFNSGADKTTGYRTSSILCAPIKTLDGTIIGVLQAVNKKDSVFQSIDEELIKLLCAQAGIALVNANICRNTEYTRDKYRSLLDIVRSVQSEVASNSLISTITQRTSKVMNADRCSLYLIDHVQNGLFAMQGEVNIRVAMDQGIAGMVATTGKTQNIPDAYNNPLFNQTIDKKTGYRTKAVLCIAIRAENKVIGVLQLINKVFGPTTFLQEDEEMLTVFLSIVGPILLESQIYESIQGKAKGRVMDIMAGEEMPSNKEQKDSRALPEMVTKTLPPYEED